MSEKMECPSCRGYSSTVLASFNNGEPCAFCGLPHEAARMVLAARAAYSESKLRDDYEKAITRAIHAEGEADRLNRALKHVADAVRHIEPFAPESWQSGMRAQSSDS